MQNQFQSMRGDVKDYLTEIERAFLSERDQILTRNYEEIKSLFSQQKTLEENY